MMSDHAEVSLLHGFILAERENSPASCAQPFRLQCLSNFGKQGLQGLSKAGRSLQLEFSCGTSPFILQTSCAAALLDNVDSMVAVRHNNAKAGPVINIIERIRLRDTLMISMDARDALGISHNGRLDSAKASQGSMTLFALLDNTKTASAYWRV